MVWVGLTCGQRVSAAVARPMIVVNPVNKTTWRNEHKEWLGSA